MKENPPPSSLKTPVGRGRRTPRKPKASDTPETDAAALHDGTVVSAEVARQLERDRNLIQKAAITWMRSWTEIHNRVTQAEVAAEEAQKHCAKFEADACNLWSERTEHGWTKKTLAAVTAERNQLRTALAQIAEDCTAWLHHESDEPSVEFIKAVRQYAHEQSHAPLVTRHTSLVTSP
jgi:hypothetical protein